MFIILYLKKPPRSDGIVTNGYITHFWICHSFLDKYIYNVCKYIQQTPYYMEQIDVNIYNKRLYEGWTAHTSAIALKFCGRIYFCLNYV